MRPSEVFLLAFDGIELWNLIQCRQHVTVSSETQFQTKLSSFDTDYWITIDKFHFSLALSIWLVYLSLVQISHILLMESIFLLEVFPLLLSNLNLRCKRPLV